MKAKSTPNMPFAPFVFAIIVSLHCWPGSILLGQKQSQHEPTATELGNTKNVHVLNNLYFAGQFQKDELETFKNKKITRVITLRTDQEIDWDEQAAVEAADIEFIKIPFLAPESLTDEVFDQCRECLKDNSKTTLLHCGSANRVGGVWLPYRVLDEGVELETALKEARQIGLKAPFIEEKALDYIKRKQKMAATTGSETSVKPGINDSFKDPNLDVDKFVKRFELESREVYSSREQIVEACEIEAGHIIADVGSGTGLFTRLFSKSVGDDGWVFAVDIAPRMVSHVTNEANKQNLTNITGVVCAENSINMPPNSVDVVFICDTYHHFEFPKSTLASIHSALRPGGRLIVIDFDRIEGKSREWLIGHVRAGKEVFRAEIQDAGFTLVEEKKVEGLKENYFLLFKK